MAGTIEGGKKAAESNKRYWGKDFYKIIGAKGGRKGAADGTIKGFATNRKLASEAGRKGGTISRRRPSAN